MSSRREEHSGRDQGAGPERVFLVGVEFLSRGLSKRETKKKSGDELEPRTDEEASANDRRQTPGRVPPVARAARSVAGAKVMSPAC